MPATPNYGWPKPDVGGSSNTWGTILNDTLDLIDNQVKDIGIRTDARLPLAGGTMTGRVTTKTASMIRVDKGSVSGAVTLDLNNGNYFTMTVGGNITSLTIANVPAGAVATGFIVKMTNGGAFTIAFGSTVKWPGGVVPTFTVAGVDTLLFITDDGGATFRASLLQKDSR